MTAWALPMDAVSGSPAFTGQQTRTAFSAFLGAPPVGRPVGVRSGARIGTPPTTVSLSGTGNTTWNVGVFSGVLDLESAATAGPYCFATDGTDTGTITAASASARTDSLYVTVNDQSQDSSGGSSCVIGYQSGSTTAPARSMIIATITVPATGGGNPSITWTAPTYGQPPMCEATPTTGQTVSSLGATAINLESASINNDGIWVSSANSKFTIQTPGIYLVCAMLTYGNASTGRWGVGLNGGSVNFLDQLGSAGMARRALFNQGDILQLQGYVSGPSLNVDPGPNLTFLSVQLVG